MRADPAILDRSRKEALARTVPAHEDETGLDQVAHMPVDGGLGKLQVACECAEGAPGSRRHGFEEDPPLGRMQEGLATQVGGRERSQGPNAVAPNPQRTYETGAFEHAQMVDERAFVDAQREDELGRRGGPAMRQGFEELGPAGVVARLVRGEPDEER